MDRATFDAYVEFAGLMRHVLSRVNQQSCFLIDCHRIGRETALGQGKIST